MNRVIALAIYAAVCLTFSFAKDVTVEGRCEYVMTADMTEAEAVETAVREAKVEALAREFGTIVSAETWSELCEDNSRLSESFYQSGMTLVKGVWLSDLHAPEVVKSISANGDILINVKVKGKARAIESLPLDLNVYASLPGAHIPQNRFRNETRFTVNFKSPADGHVAIYLGDEEGDICRLLPFSRQPESSTRVEAMKDYEFFTSQEGDEEQYSFITFKPRERNTLYIIYAKREFPRPIDIYNAERNLRILKLGEFYDWVGRLRSADTSVQVETIPIEIIR